MSKAGLWYLVAGVKDSPRVFQVSWLIEVVRLEQTFQRPAGFNLEKFWQAWCAEYEWNQRAYLVKLRVSPDLIRLLPLYFGRQVLEQLSQAGPPDAEGWLTITLPFESLEAARGQILDIGASAEVIEPEPLRCSLVDFAEQIVKFYRKK